MVCVDWAGGFPEPKMIGSTFGGKVPGACKNLKSCHPDYQPSQRSAPGQELC